VFGLAGVASAGLFVAYLLVPHVAARIQRFMNPASGDTFQIDTALEAFYNGGWFGVGPGGGIGKPNLPDSHTDFVFAVAAEEFGIVLCLILLSLFAFIVIRALSRAYATEDMFSRFAASGLAVLFGIQAAINMSVNLQLIPAKGMTLPFISYGGSSIVAMAYGVGMMLALTRNRPLTEMESISDANASHSYACRTTHRRRLEAMDNAPLILLAAGGTGGHLFPAEALGVELMRRGNRVRLATDARALRYSGLFSKDMIDVVPSETVRGRTPWALARTGLMLGYGTMVALNLVRRLKTGAVGGFGGTPAA